MDGSIPAEADLRPSSYAAGMMQPVRTLRCVIVDDNRAFLTIAALVLERDGVAVVATTTSSAEALERLERLHPDVVLVDIELGGESGFDVARAIHRHPWVAVPAPPVILISAHDERDFADQVAASPASGFLPKWKLSAAAIRKSLAGVAEGEHETNPTAQTMRAGSYICGRQNPCQRAHIRRRRWQCSLASPRHEDSLTEVAATTLMLDLHLPLIQLRWIRLLIETAELGNGESGSVGPSRRLSAFGRDARRSS